jgi:hypothetical protein
MANILYLVLIVDKSCYNSKLFSSLNYVVE